MTRPKTKRKIKSGFEGRAKEMLKDRGVRVEYEVDTLEYDIPAKYTPDFTITRDDGSTFFIEAKGYFDNDDRRKMKHVKRCNPHADIRIWFQRDSWLSTAHSGRYSDWAEKNGFPYHVGESFPQHWFEADSLNE